MYVNIIMFLFQIHELKQVRNLVSQITSKGAKLYDLLGKEVELGVSENTFLFKYQFRITFLSVYSSKNL